MTTNGVGACLLGYANPKVTEAVVERICNGSMSSLNAPEEVALADKLCDTSNLDGVHLPGLQPDGAPPPIKRYWLKMTIRQFLMLSADRFVSPVLPAF